MCFVSAFSFSPAWADGYDDTIAVFKKAGESGAYSGKSYEYAVFPTDNWRLPDQNRNMSTKKLYLRGFTLFKVLLVVGIVGLLTSIALPAFQSYTARARHSASDPALESILLQHMGYTAPSWMSLGSRATVEIGIGGDRTVDELISLLKPSGQTGGEVITVSERMAARLIAPNFTVTPVSAEIQQVSRKEPTIWTWSIEANASGKQPIYLSVDALYLVDGKDAARSSSLERTIIVEVDSWQARWAWAKHNWTIVAFALTALGGIIAFLLKRKRAVSRQD